MNLASRFLLLLLLFAGLTLAEKIYAQADELLGPVTKQEILEGDRIFEIYIERYEPTKESVRYLSAYPDSVEIMVFLGSWCRDSRKYIPGLMKTLELASSDFLGVNYIGVDQQKKIPESLLKKFDIKYIPTVVVLKGNKELGRIEEKPHQLIETDLVQIMMLGID